MAVRVSVSVSVAVQSTHASAHACSFVVQNVDMENTRGLMDQTLNNLNKLLANGGSGHMCMLITFVVAVFLVLYYVIQWK